MYYCRMWAACLPPSLCHYAVVPAYLGLSLCLWLSIHSLLPFQCTHYGFLPACLSSTTTASLPALTYHLFSALLYAPHMPNHLCLCLFLPPGGVLPAWSPLVGGLLPAFYLLCCTKHGGEETEAGVMTCLPLLPASLLLSVPTRLSGCAAATPPACHF